MDTEMRELILPVIRARMPHASEAEIEEATENMRRFLAVACRVYDRLEREGRLPLCRDKSAADATFDLQYPKQT